MPVEKSQILPKNNKVHDIGDEDLVHDNEKLPPIKIQPGLPNFDVSNAGLDMSKTGLLVKDDLINSSSESMSFDGSPSEREHASFDNA